jgi:hypothetical protein
MPTARISSGADSTHPKQRRHEHGISKITQKETFHKKEARRQEAPCQENSDEQDRCACR